MNVIQTSSVTVHSLHRFNTTSDGLSPGTMLTRVPDPTAVAFGRVMAWRTDGHRKPVSVKVVVV